MPPITFPPHLVLLLDLCLATLLPACPAEPPSQAHPVRPAFPAGGADMLLAHMAGLPAEAQAHALHTTQQLLEHLQQLQTVEAWPTGLDAAGQTQRQQALSVLKRQHLRLFSDFFVLAMQAYCLQPQVLQALGEEARPPFPDGYCVPEVAGGGLDLLEPVYDRGPCYRAVPPNC